MHLGQQLIIFILSAKIALVTGGSRGLGKEMARQIIALGQKSAVIQLDMGQFGTIPEFVPFIHAQCGIINISSGTTRFCVPGYAVYSSIKAVVEVFIKYLAKELGAKGLRASIVAPGPIATDFNNAAIRSNLQIQSFITSQTPLGRVGQADDTGGVVAFLCRDDARWINGQRIEESGGINL